MSESAVPRPRQVTLSGALIMSGSVILVLATFQRMGTLGSIEFQEQAARTLAEPPADGLGLSVHDLQTAVRVLCLLAGASGAAAAVLGYFVLQRSRSSRTALAFVTPVLLVAGFAVGGFVAAFVAAGVVMLWVQPARAWFDPRPAVAAAPSRPGGPAGPAPARSTSSAPAPWDLPPPMSRRAPTSTPSPYGAPGRMPSGAGRPVGVVIACVVAWTGSGLVGLLAALTGLVALGDRGAVLDEVRPDLADAGVSDDQFVVALLVVATITVLWSLLGAGLAVAAFRRLRWGWLGLVASSAAAALACLVLAVASAVLVLPLVGCLLAVVLLLRADARAWYARPARR